MVGRCTSQADVFKSTHLMSAIRLAANFAGCRGDFLKGDQQIFTLVRDARPSAWQGGCAVALTVRHRLADSWSPTRPARPPTDRSGMRGGLADSSPGARPRAVQETPPHTRPDPSAGR